VSTWAEQAIDKPSGHTNQLAATPAARRDPDGLEYVVVQVFARMAVPDKSDSLVDRGLFRVSIDVKPRGKLVPRHARAHFYLKALHSPLPLTTTRLAYHRARCGALALLSARSDVAAGRPVLGF